MVGQSLRGPSLAVVVLVLGSFSVPFLSSDAQAAWTSVTAVSTGLDHTCVLLATGNVDCYGDNYYGEADDYSGGDAASVFTGGFHTCVVKTTGNADCYGDNFHGAANDYLGGDAVAAGGGSSHTCIVKATGNVDCYGYNYFGQAADYLGGDATAISRGADADHTCVLRSGGNVDCYGLNYDGQAADYLGGDAIAVSAGRDHTCVLRATGNVDCYGSNAYGQAADYLGGDATGVSAGLWHTCILKMSGIVHCWGHNSNGEAVDYGPPASPPLGLTARRGATNPEQVSLDWLAPADDGGSAITAYNLYRGTTSGGETFLATTGNVLTFTDTCPLGTTCYYQVSATTSHGEGARSDEAATAGLTVTQTVPGVPVTTPPVVLPALCTLSACTTPVTTPPIGTPGTVVPEVCVLPVGATLLCVGPVPVPPQSLVPGMTIPAVCAVAAPACIGPVTVLPGSTLLTTPVVSVALSVPWVSGGVTMNPAGAIGPIRTNVTIPVLDITVPVSLCPTTCPFPVDAHGAVEGTLSVTVTVGSTTQSVTVPLPAIRF